MRQYSDDHGVRKGIVLLAADGHSALLFDGHPDPGQTEHVHVQRLAGRARFRPVSLLQFHPDEDEQDLEDIQPRLKGRH